MKLKIVKKLLLLSLVGAFSLSTFAAELAPGELSPSTTLALETIASRKGTNRLDFDEARQQWSLFETSWTTLFLRPLSKKNRFDMMAPLENLVSDVEGAHLASHDATPETVHLVRKAYSSLSSLYSYYKINPHTNIAQQADFMRRFGMVLSRFKIILNELESRMSAVKLFKLIPWDGEQGVDIGDDDKRIGLKYLDMGEHGLRELNNTLSEIGNRHTKIDRAAEFYPTDKHTVFQSSVSETVSKKIAIFVVHGTFSADSPEYTSDKNILFQQTKYMAQAIANDQNVPVELYAFGWNGANSNEDRMVAGEELANFVNSYFPREEYLDVYIGHSHGGNVIFHYAKTQREYRTPHLVVTLATPIRKDFITDNLNYLFEFYTTSDLIQYAGSFEISLRNSTGTGTHAQSPRLVNRDDIRSLGLYQNNNRYDGTKIYTVRTLLNSQALPGRIKSHTHMKYLIGALPKVLNELIQYKTNSSFALNVALEPSEKLSANHMETLQFQVFSMDKP